MRIRILAACAALSLGLVACSSGTPTNSGGGAGGGAPTDGTLTVGLALCSQPSAGDCHSMGIHGGILVTGPPRILRAP